MKRFITIAALAMAVVAMTTSVALAASGNSGYTGYSYGTGSMTASWTTSPHGDYITSSAKCAVCHAVHRAGTDGNGTDTYKLLRTTSGNASASGACIYCHFDNAGNMSGAAVYGGLYTNFTTASNFGHTADGVGCQNCHQVHGANTVPAAPAGNNAMHASILRLDASSTVVPDTAAGWSNVYNTPQALSNWCSGCHNYLNTDGTFKASHIMKDAGGSSIAFSSSSDCSSCHNATGFPHYSPNAVRFLMTDASVGATQSAQDGVCKRCHVNGVNGVGLTF